MKTIFYGLRPVIAGLIAYAAIHFGSMGNSYAFFTWQTFGTVIIVVIALFDLVKNKMHPLTIIVASSILGVAFF